MKFYQFCVRLPLSTVIEVQDIADRAMISRAAVIRMLVDKALADSKEGVGKTI